MLDHRLAVVHAVQAELFEQILVIIYNLYAGLSHTTAVWLISKLPRRRK